MAKKRGGVRTKAAKPPAPTGRPTKYTAAVATEITRRMSTGETIATICAGEQMPARTTVLDWRRDNAEFRKAYDEAHLALVQHWIDEIVDIADDARNDWMDAQRGEDTIRVLDHEHVTRSALRIKTRQWLAAKLLQKYRDKTEVKHTGDAFRDFLAAAVKAGSAGPENPHAEGDDNEG